MKKLNFRECYMITSQLSMILSSGFQIDMGLDMIEEKLDDEDIKEVIHKLNEEFKDSMNLSQAVENSKCFDLYFQHMVKIGEESGNLDKVMESLSLYYDRMYDIETQYHNALTYPAILIIMMLVVVGVITFKVLPLFQSILNSMGSSLSNYALSFMKFGQVFSLISFILLLIISLVIIIIVIINKIKPEKQIYDTLIKKIINSQKINQTMSLAQLTYALSLFLSSGYDLNQAINYLPEFIEDKGLKEKLVACKEDMNNGLNFEDAITKNDVYEGIYLNMIQIGFSMGQQDQVMSKLSQLYNQEVYLTISKFLNVVEPSIVVILSVIVGIILLSVFLPLISIMSSL